MREIHMWTDRLRVANETGTVRCYRQGARGEDWYTHTHICPIRGSYSDKKRHGDYGDDNDDDD